MARVARETQVMTLVNEGGRADTRIGAGNTNAAVARLYRAGGECRRPQ